MSDVLKFLFPLLEHDPSNQQAANTKCPALPDFWGGGLELQKNVEHNHKGWVLGGCVVLVPNEHDLRMEISHTLDGAFSIDHGSLFAWTISPPTVKSKLPLTPSTASHSGWTVKRCLCDQKCTGFSGAQATSNCPSGPTSLVQNRHHQQHCQTKQRDSQRQM